jgi:hypothetical protein
MVEIYKAKFLAGNNVFQLEVRVSNPHVIPYFEAHNFFFYKLFLKFIVFVNLKIPKIGVKIWQIFVKKR